MPDNAVGVIFLRAEEFAMALMEHYGDPDIKYDDGVYEYTFDKGCLLFLCAEDQGLSLIEAKEMMDYYYQPKTILILVTIHDCDTYGQVIEIDEQVRKLIECEAY